jgi:hypothetical protein
MLAGLVSAMAPNVGQRTERAELLMRREKQIAAIRTRTQKCES